MTATTIDQQIYGMSHWLESKGFELVIYWRKSKWVAHIDVMTFNMEEIKDKYSKIFNCSSVSFEDLVNDIRLHVLEMKLAWELSQQEQL